MTDGQWPPPTPASQASQKVHRKELTNGKSPKNGGRTHSVTNFKAVMKMQKRTNELVVYTQDQITSVVFKETHKTSSVHFTRNSPLNFKTTALLTLKMIKKSIKVERMDYFYQAAKDVEIPSRQALSEARGKISYHAFKDLFDKSCELAIRDDNSRKYKGYRLFAIDGTSFAVGKLKNMSRDFGESTTIPGKAMCRISGVVDVLEDSIIDACVSPFSVGERALAVGQIGGLSTIANALYLFDRGYWSPKLTAHIMENGQKFLMRLASNTGKAIAKDVEGNEHDLRRYSFTLPGGDVETLLTNIPEEEMSNDELAALYAKRWGIETKYLELKDRLQIDKFSSQSANIVLQDIYATLYISNLTAFICLEADEKIRERTVDKGNKYEQKANRSVCISALRKRFIDICLLDDPSKQCSALERLRLDISKCVSYVGKSKSRPRDKRKIKSARQYRNMSFL